MWLQTTKQHLNANMKARQRNGEIADKFFPNKNRDVPNMTWYDDSASQEFYRKKMQKQTN